MASGGLLERDGELRVLADLCARARTGAGGLVVIDGPAGVGKTSLLNAARAAAGMAGLAVLGARGAELERAFAFGAVRQLFDGVLRDAALDRATLFAGAARRAAPLLEVELGETAAAPGEPFAVRHALYWLTANLAAGRPLALLVDDAQWADGDSLGFLAHLANRLERTSVALIVAARGDEAGAALDALRDEAERDGRLLRLQPLGADAAATVVRAFAPTADDALCRACHVATGGNPFLLEELARAGELDARARRRAEPRARHARGRRAPRPAAGRLRAAGARRRRARQRDRAARRGAAGRRRRSGAAGGRGGAAERRRAARARAGRVPPPARAHRRLRRHRTGRALERARARGEAAGRRRRRDRARRRAAAADPSGRRRVDERATGRGGAAGGRPRRLRTGRDLPAAGAGGAAAGGAAAAAAAGAGRRGREGLDPLAAIEHLRAALADELSGDERFGATMLLAGLLGFAWRVEEAVELLEQQVEALDDHPELRRTAEAALVNLARIDGRTRIRGAAVAQRLEGAVGAGEEDPAVLGTVAAELAMRCDPHERVAAVAEAALRQVTAGAAAPDWSAWNAIRALVVSERWEAAQRALEWALEGARERGALIDVGAGLIFRAELRLRLGELAAAEADARALGEIAAAYGWPMGEGFAVAWLAAALVERGALDEAARLFADARFDGAAETVPHAYPSTWLLLSRGRLRWAQARLEEAAEDIREAGRRAAAIGHVNPVVAGWRAPLAELLVALGQPAEARLLAREQQELAQQFGTPLAVAVARGTTALVEDDPRERLALRREAARLLDGSRARLEAARAQLALGAELQRAGLIDDAHAALRQAVDLARACGATVLAQEALARLRATGATAELTETGGEDA